jgi:hypothetical protein
MMLNKTFHLILLFLIPIFGFSQEKNSQYPDSGNKIRLGFQTTGDGLIWRDTQPKVGVYQPINNKAAWIVLDTVNNKFYHYKNSAWTLAGGQDIDTANIIATKYDLGLKLTTTDTGNMLLPYWRSGKFSGVLPVANGGTGSATQNFVDLTNTQTVNGLKTFTDTMRIEDAIKVGANNAYVYSAGTGNYYFTKDFKNQSGTYAIAIGDGVLSNATTVSNPASSRHGSVAIGFDNLKNLTQSAGTNQGVYNTSIGINNMSSVTTGGFNTSVGALSLKLLTTGGSNVAIGTTTLENMTTGGSNLGLGDGAFRFASTGSNNVGIGSNAGVFDAVGGNQVTSIDNSIYIGQRADPSATTGVTNEVAIGYLAKGQGSNTVTFGNTNTTKTILNGNVGIGTASPGTNKLHIHNGSSGGSAYNAGGLVVESSGRASIQLLAPNNSDSFLFFGDANSGTGGYIGHYGTSLTPADLMVYYSEGNHSFTNGNVGIGTNQPTSKLHVVGSIEINDGSAGAGTNPTIRSLNNFIDFSLLQFYPQTGTNVNQSFQVIPRGIGASNNKTQFVIFGTDYIADGTNTEYLVLRARDNDFVLLTGKDGTGTQKPFILSGDGLVTNQLVLATNSNVGIGTTSPDAKLEVIGGIAQSIIIADNETNATRKFGGLAHKHYTNAEEPISLIWADAKSNANDVYIGGGTIEVNAATSLKFYTSANNNTITGTERMRITSGGDVCVATTTASYSAVNRGNLTIGGVSSSLFAFQTNNTDRSYLYHDGTNFSLVNNSSGGGVYMSSNGGGVVLSSGATSWASSSDERLKNINYNIENVVSKLSSLRTVNFSWKSDQTKKEFLGLIAQDVEKVFPQVISKNNLPSNINDVQIDKTEYLSVRYTELIPVLVKAVQELSAEIDILKQEIINLKNK